MIGFKQNNYKSLETFKKLDEADIQRICDIWIEKQQLSGQKDLYVNALHFLIKSIHIIPWARIFFHFYEFRGKITLIRYYQDQTKYTSLKQNNKINWFYTDGHSSYSSQRRPGDTIHIKNAKIVIEAIQSTHYIDDVVLLQLNIWEQKHRHLKKFIEYIQTQLHSD